MAVIYGEGIGIKNRYDALLLDEPVDKLEAVKKSTEKTPSIRNQLKKQAKCKYTTSTQIKQYPKEQTQAKGKKPPARVDKRSGKKAKKPVDKPVTKKTNSKKSATAVEALKEILEMPDIEQLTLEEYKESSALNRCEAPKYNIRQPGEGEDLSQWENLVPLEKKKCYNKEEWSEIDASDMSQRGRRQRRLAVDVRFEDSIANRRGRREMVPRRVVSSFCPESIRFQCALKVDNEQEFPSLGH